MIVDPFRLAERCVFGGTLARGIVAGGLVQHLFAEQRFRVFGVRRVSWDGRSGFTATRADLEPGRGS